MTRRDLLLQEMGVSQWELRRTGVLHGSINMKIAPTIRLLIVSEPLLPHTNPIIQDLLRALELGNEHTQLLNLDQLSHIQFEHTLNCWLLSKNSSEIDRAFEVLQHLPIKNIWQSPSLLQLQTQPQTKRALWQQIQQSKPLE